MQVRAGEVFATVGGESRERNPDEFMTVAAGERLLIETGDDSAVLQTVDSVELRPGGQRRRDADEDHDPPRSRREGGGLSLRAECTLSWATRILDRVSSEK